jgi:hypothetical protein
MKFNVLGEEISVEWGHVFSVAGVMLISAVLTALISMLLPFIEDNASIMQGLDFLLNIAQPFYPAAFAFIAIAIAIGIFKMKKDAALCRSIVGAFLLVGLGIALLGAISYVEPILSYHPKEVILYAIQTGLTYLIDMLIGAMMIYIWMLAVSAPDMQKARKMAAPAAVFALIMYAISILPMLIGVAEGQYIPYYLLYSIATTHTFIYLLSHFVFGFIILYHIWGNKLENMAYLFAALYLLSPVVAMAGDFLSYGILDAWATLAAIVKLTVLYCISRPDLKDRFDKLLGI